MTCPARSSSALRNHHGNPSATPSGAGWRRRAVTVLPRADSPHIAISSSESLVGRPLSGSRWTQTDTSSTPPASSPAGVIEVRRSAHILPSPLQNVASVNSAPKRGNRVTRIRVRRTTHSARPARPASTESAYAMSCAQRASASSRIRPVGEQSASPGRTDSVNTRPRSGEGTISCTVNQFTGSGFGGLAALGIHGAVPPGILARRSGSLSPRGSRADLFSTAGTWRGPGWDAGARRPRRACITRQSRAGAPGRAVLRVIVMHSWARPAVGRSGAELCMPENPRNGREDDRTHPPGARRYPPR